MARAVRLTAGQRRSSGRRLPPLHRPTAARARSRGGPFRREIRGRRPPRRTLPAGQPVDRPASARATAYGRARSSCATINSAAARNSVPHKVEKGRRRSKVRREGLAREAHQHLEAAGSQPVRPLETDAFDRRAANTLNFMALHRESKIVSARITKDQLNASKDAAHERCVISSRRARRRRAEDEAARLHASEVINSRPAINNTDARGGFDAANPCKPARSNFRSPRGRFA